MKKEKVTNDVDPKIRENIAAVGTEGVNVDKAEKGWVKYYDSGIMTSNVDIFFAKDKRNIRYVKTRAQIYASWRHGYK